MTAKTTANQSLYLFFLLLPFTYALQVLVGSPEVAGLAYIFLGVSVALLFTDACRAYAKSIAPGLAPNLLPLGFGFLILHHLISVSGGFFAGYSHLAVRGFLLFSLPLLLFAIMPLLRVSTLRTLVVLLAICGLLTSMEMLYESVSVRVFQETTPFQLLNRDYVIARTGEDLSQLWHFAYRPPGLLEHLHAVTTFASLASLAYLVLFCLEGRWYWFTGMVLCVAALLQHGARLPVASAILAVGVLWTVFARGEHEKRTRRRGAIAISALAVLLLFQLFVDPVGTTRTYYLPALLRGDFGVPDKTTPQMLQNAVEAHFVVSEWGKLLFGQGADLRVALWGFGIIGSMRGVAGADDDFFIMQVISQYGILGAMIFLGVWGSALYMAFRMLRGPGLERLEPLDRALLYFAFGVLIILSSSMLHSSVLQRKAIYPLFPVAAGIVWRYWSGSRNRIG